jgi:hypothetical protein
MFQPSPSLKLVKFNNSQILVSFGELSNINFSMILFFSCWSYTPTRINSTLNSPQQVSIAYYNRIHSYI